MTESLYIYNVGPIKEAEMPDIRQFTVIIGPSASGKSTVMKIMALMRYIFKVAAVRSWLKNSRVRGVYHPIRIHNCFTLMGVEYMINSGSRILYKVEINGHNYAIEYDNNKLSTLPILAPEDLVFTKVSFISETRNVIPDWAAFGASAGLQSRSRLGYYFQETYSDFDEATNELSDVNLTHLGMNLTVKKENGRKKFIISQDGAPKPFELRHASSGVRASSSIVTIVGYMARNFSFKEALKRASFDFLYQAGRLDQFNGERSGEFRNYVCIHVEEPELSLYPDAQRRLMDTLAHTCFVRNDSARNVSLIIATHSPYIINHLNVMFRRSFKADAGVSLKPENAGVYLMLDGHMSSLMSTDLSTNETVVDTTALSESMIDIYNEYTNLASVHDAQYISNRIPQ